MLIPAAKQQAALKSSDSFTLTSSSALFAQDMFSQQADALAPLLNLSRTQDSGSAAVRIVYNGELANEAYKLSCDSSGIDILSGTPEGAAHALASIMQLTEGGTKPMQYQEIFDVPAYPWRTLNFDMCRHFFGVSTIKKVIDLLWLYKFSTLHLHLSDDQGYRIESERYPRLNTVGSYRTSSAIKRGDGEKQDGKPHGGYLTKAEARELVSYASARGINIVPEIDIPGHTTAIIAAYPELACFPRETQVATEYGFKDFSAHLLCSAKESVYELLFGIIDEIAEIFPSKYFHIGGDEAMKEEWQKCPACQALKKEKGLKNERELQGYMLSRIRDHVSSLGREAIVWNDGLCDSLGTNVISQQWTPRAVEGTKCTVKLLENGGKALFSGFEHLYLDYPYSMTPLKKTYSYTLPQLSQEALKGVIGIECCLWGEWIEDEVKIFYNLLPRLAAVSELTWNGDARADYSDFVKRLPSHYALYERMGYNYAKGREKSEGYIKRLRTTKTFWTKDAYVEIPKD